MPNAKELNYTQLKATSRMVVGLRAKLFLTGLCMVSLAVTDAYHNHRLRTPSDRITLIQVGDKGSSPPLQLDDVEEITKRMNEVEKAKDQIGSQLSEVKESINREELKIQKQVELKKEMVKRAREKETNKAEEKKKLADAATQKIVRFRLKINNCLSTIKGGANKIYWKLRNLFSRAEPEMACTLLKHYEFPTLTKHGFKERIFKKYGIGERPSEDGDTVLSFDAIKLPLFNCMCTSAGSGLQKPKFESSNKDKLQAEFERQAAEEKLEEEKQKKVVATSLRLEREKKQLDMELAAKEEAEAKEAVEIKKKAAKDTVAYTNVEEPTKDRLN